MTALIVMSMVGSAFAGEVDDEPAWETYVGTRAPALIGVGVVYPLPHRLRLATEIGILPGGYVDMINAVVQAFDGYGDATAELVEIATRNSLLVHIDAGYQPFANRGFYAGVGYSLATLGGASSGQELLEEVVGVTAPESRDGSTTEFDIASTLHNVEVLLGWRFDLPQRFTLRTELGVLWCVAAAVDVEVTSERAGTAALETAAEIYLVETYERYVVSPTIGLWVGRRW